MDAKTLQIVDVYHEFHDVWESDTFSRANVHGLNPEVFEDRAFATEQKLVNHFLEWLLPKNYMKVFGHAPGRESKRFNIVIEDLKLPCWADRDGELFHIFANRCKMDEAIFCGRRCIRANHSSYCRNMPARTAGQLARERHGYHCALYDCFELYLFYLLLISI